MRFHIVLYLLLVVVVGTFLTQTVHGQELLIDENGKVYIQWGGNVLSETTRLDSNTTSGLGTSGATGSTGTSGKTSDDEAGEELDDNDTGVEEDDDTSEIKQQVTGNGSTLKRVDLDNGSLRVKIRSLDDEDDEDEATRPAQQVKTIRIREYKNQSEIVIRSSDDGVEVTQGKVRARTNFPITIGANNELIITTPAGTKIVAILPDAAMKKLLEKGFPVVTPTPAPTPGDSTDSGKLEESTTEVQETEVVLEVEDDKLVYKAKSIHSAKFLGMLPVTGEVEAVISAETGQVLSYEEQWYFKYLGFFFK